MNKQGFTLAEILIAMAIIGIVAALTIPALSKAYQKRVLTTQLQRAYAELSQAGTTVIASEMTGDFNKSEALRDVDFIGKYLVVAQKRNGFAPTYGVYGDDDELEDVDLYTNEILNMIPHGTSEEDYDKYFKCGITKAGAAVCILKNGTGILDINGTKGPNLMGRDAFSIGFNSDGTVSTAYSHTLDRIVWNDWNIDKIDKKDGVENDENNDNNDDNND